MTQQFPIRVLHRGMSYNKGGIESYLINYYKHIDRSLVQFDFLVPSGITIAYEDEIKAMGGHVYKEIVGIKSNPIKGLTYDKLFFKKHPEIDILHINDCSAANLRLMKTAKKCGVNTRILHSHNNDYLAPLRRRQLITEKHNKKHLQEIATDLFACSKEAGEFMFGTLPFHIVKNAVDVEKYVFSLKKRQILRKQLGISEDRTVIGCVARLDYQKNHAFLLKVFEEYRKIDKKSLLILVGEGPLRVSIERQIKELGLSDSVMMLGIRDDVPDLLNVFDVFVLPSLSEGLGIVLIEGQINGLNCLVSDQVPNETDILGKIDFLSLNDPVSVWAKKIATMVSIKDRKIDVEVVRKAGYDISIESKKLQEFYLSKARLD